MKPILVAYATREGHTARIARHIFDLVRARGLSAEILEVTTGDETADWNQYSAALMAASIHFGHHEREMVQFVKKAQAALAHLPTAFLSVSLSEAAAEAVDLPDEKRREAMNAVAEMMDNFFRTTGWHPDESTGVAGALMYSKYNLLIRWVMKQIARNSGGDTDTSTDHIYTDWTALDRFVDHFIATLESHPQSTAG